MAQEATIAIGELFLEVDGNYALSRRGDYILSFKIDYQPRYTQSKEDLETLKDTWDRALRSLPIGTIVCKSDCFMKKKFEVLSMPQTNFIQKSTAKHFQNREYLEHDGYLFMVFPKNNTLKNAQIRNPFTFPNLQNFDKDKSSFALFKSQVQECVTVLNKSDKIYLTPLVEDDMLNYAYSWLNGFNQEYATDLVFDTDVIHSDQQRIGMFSITDEMSFPDTINYSKRDKTYSLSTKGFIFHQGLMDDLGVTLNMNHIYNQIIILDDSKKHIAAAYKTYDNLMKSRKFGHDNLLGAERVKEYLDDLRTTENENAKFVRGHTNVIFFADNQDEFDQNKNILKSIFSESGIGITPYYPMGERLKNQYLNSLFVNTPVLNTKSCYLVDMRVATCLFLTNGAYVDDKEGIYFEDRIFNKPLKFDMWDLAKKRLTSRNIGFYAPTGRGKSVLANAIQSGLIDTQDVIVVNIDLGRSYEKLAKLYDPTEVGYFRYEEGKPLGLNPFILEDDEESVGELKVAEVSEIVWIVIKKVIAPSENEKTSMRKIVNAYYTVMLADQKKDQLGWQSFFDFVKVNGNKKEPNLLTVLEIDPEFFNIKEFLHAGSEFVEGGVFQNVFLQDPHTPARSFNGKKLIIFELDEIKEQPVLLSLMLQIISETIARVIWKDKSKRGLIFFDEFAKTLQFPGIIERVSYYAQAIRKQNGALGIVLQNANQFPDTPEARSILGNLETTIVMPTDEEIVIKSLSERKDLSEHDIVQIRSMKHDFNGTRKFSEFFMKRGSSFSQVFRLELAPEVLLAYQTEGEEATRIMELYNETQNMETAILSYMEERSNKITKKSK